ncbi:toxin glutamine deamidase domain-containing protein [Arthrobacter sp. SLBN-53]|uniref:VG15 protein n=1 Tax=Arthrobacter sp. SLBN-53 TaxID=2768412 RepID=UPI0011523277|nr:toxin glutamine deamidase domain-containing protein [Arthrobacter sp. SLBN-53]TQK29388.1 papain fold toxin 1 (glutamine deamidase) of polymorphic toxin system [Arthrobacter sp. SLBN-53]
MAPPPARRQSARNSAVVALAQRQLAALWPRVDWSSPNAPAAVQTIYRAITTRYGQSAAAVSARFYDQLRTEHNLPSRYRAAPAAPVPDEQVSSIVESAFRGHVRVDVLDDDELPADLTTSELPVDQRVQTRLEQSLSRLVLQPGRDTVADNAAQDPAKPRWIRVPTGERTCAFCVMLASRDVAVIRGRHIDMTYRSSQSAGIDGSSMFNTYHKGCDCVAVPVFPDDSLEDLSPNIGDYKDVYNKATAAAGTHSDTKKILREMRRILNSEQPTPAPAPRPDPPIVEPPPVDLDIPDRGADRDQLPDAPAVADPLPGVRRKADLAPDPVADLAATNPNFRAGEEWQINCTRCATTIELRARGYDVTARPRPRTAADAGYTHILERWLSPDGSTAGSGPGAMSTRAAAPAGEALGAGTGTRMWDWLPAGRKAARKAADDAVSQWGDGARGYITVEWQGRRSAHIFNVANRGGKVVYTDGQSNEVDASGHWDRITTGDKACRIVRTDDLTPTARVMEWVRELTDTDVELAANKARMLARTAVRTSPASDIPIAPVIAAVAGSDGGGGVDRSQVRRGLRQHELDTADRLARRGHMVAFIAATGAGRSADATIDGETWELKAITGASEDAIARNLRTAAKQADAVVLDVTDSSLSEDRIKVLVAHYGRRYNLQQVRVIRGNAGGMDWRWSNGDRQ